MSQSRLRSASLLAALAPMKEASPAVAATSAPWVLDGIDYGPARAALVDLATWALDLAENSVDDWPVARAHVRNTRRWLMAQISGRRGRSASVEDVEFTAALLARIFDVDLELAVSDALTILDALDLPLDVVAVDRRAPRATKRRNAAVTPLEARAPRASAPPQLRFCDDCGYVHEPGDHVRHERERAA